MNQSTSINYAEIIINTSTTNYELMEQWGYTTAAIVLILIGFVGFFFNIFVIILMCRNDQLWTPMNIILFNLVCSDFSVSIFGNPFTVTAAIYHRWVFGKTICVAYGFFMSLLGITSISTLTVLAYERFCLVAFPFSSKQLNNRRAFASIVLIWLYSLAITIPPLFGWGKYVNESANISCSVNWESKTTNTMTYILYLFFFGLFIPIVIIGYCYINIVKTIKTSSKRMNKTKKSERKVTAMVAVMIIAFLVAWTPYAIFALIKQFGPANIIGPGLSILPSLIAKSSICYNPIIYVGMNSQFRNAFSTRKSSCSETVMAATMNTNDIELNSHKKISQTNEKVTISNTRGKTVYETVIIKNSSYETNLV